MTPSNLFQNQLIIIKENVYTKCGFVFKNLNIEKESEAYGACTFELNDLKIIYRTSKITPSKSGQFVTIWKRNTHGITEPFQVSDDFDFIVITAKSDQHFGQFIFPKEILSQQKIITNKNSEGKRGIRVYPPWDKVTNKQAEKTQKWQVHYFVSVYDNNSVDQLKAKSIFNKL